MICAIVLAAGKSERMGTQKVLLPLAGVTILEHIVGRIAGSVVDRTFVVVGHEGARVVKALEGCPVSVVMNPAYQAGMLSSVRCGLRALPAECEAVLIALGDQPRLSTGVIDTLVRAFSGCSKGIAVPIHRGRRGHPLIFASSYRPEIIERYDDEGLRGLLVAHPGDILEVEVSVPYILEDMDVPGCQGGPGKGHRIP